ncbi:MAG TPA: YdhR family protein [Vitreimonas sp.]|jgi:heme-degrading monooxygenase HmoA|nr:YdhR family protein [Vitreimonas sp.]
MHVLVITFHLDGISEVEYLATCNQVAPAFAAVPGLISKTFIADRATNTYGGVYFWRDRDSVEAFKQSDLARAVATDPTLAGFTIQEFEVLEEPSRVTRGLAAVAA